MRVIRGCAGRRKARNNEKPQGCRSKQELEQPTLECASGAVPHYRLPCAGYAARRCLSSLAYE